VNDARGTVEITCSYDIFTPTEWLKSRAMEKEKEGYKVEFKNFFERQSLIFYPPKYQNLSITPCDSHFLFFWSLWRELHTGRSEKEYTGEWVRSLAMILSYRTNLTMEYKWDIRSDNRDNRYTANAFNCHLIACRSPRNQHVVYPDDRYIVSTSDRHMVSRSGRHWASPSGYHVVSQMVVMWSPQVVIMRSLSSSCLCYPQWLSRGLLKWLLRGLPKWLSRGLPKWLSRGLPKRLSHSLPGSVAAMNWPESCNWAIKKVSSAELSQKRWMISLLIMKWNYSSYGMKPFSAAHRRSRTARLSQQKSDSSARSNVPPTRTEKRWHNHLLSLNKEEMPLPNA
jgi:hypothetical protein